MSIWDDLVFVAVLTEHVKVLGHIAVRHQLRQLPILQVMNDDGYHSGLMFCSSNYMVVVLLKELEVIFFGNIIRLHGAAKAVVNLSRHW